MPVVTMDRLPTRHDLNRLRFPYDICEVCGLRLTAKIFAVWVQESIDHQIIHEMQLNCGIDPRTGERIE